MQTINIMNLRRTLKITFCVLCLQTTIAQELTEEQKERLEYKVDIFTSNEEEFQT